MSKDVSIIIPFYNTPQHLFEKMIESVLKQNINSYEIIIINDGSDVVYSEVLNTCTRGIENVKIINQPNLGVSAARNRGMEEAEGEYITFVDADDVLSDVFLESALTIAKEGNYDVVYGMMKKARNYGEIQQEKSQKNYISLRDDEIKYIESSLVGGVNERIPFIIEGSPCARLIRRSVISNIRFDINIRFFEDQIFNREIARVIRTAAVTNNTWYYYIQQPNSAMHKNKGDIDFYLKIKPYWDRLYKMNIIENKEIQKYANIAVLNEYIRFIHMSVLVSKDGILKKRICLMEAACHNAICYALKYINENRIKLGKKDKVTYFCLKNHLYIVLLFLVSINAKLRGQCS